jgi:Cu/Zn superoxide dismutase
LKQFKTFTKVMLAAILLMTVGCSNDDNSMINPEPDGPMSTGVSKTYALGSVANPDISGTAKFIENTDNSITIELELRNTPAGEMHPAHIHFNTAAEGGDIALTLGTVDGSTGKSSVTITALNDNTPITYDALLDFDGYINVHLSADDLETLVAQGDIGQNELTGVSKEYTLNEKAAPGIDGKATFYERVNGEALAVLNINNTPADGAHPAHIHLNTAVQSGAIAYTFKSVDGNTGLSSSNLAQLDNGTVFGYAEILEFNGYINVHLSAEALGTIVAQGDIGQNELTGRKVSYELATKDVAGISGMATFEERLNETTLVTLELVGTPDGGMHPAHIHENDAATGGNIIVGLTPVNGTTGISQTQVASFVGGALVTYEEFLTIDAYINVHLDDTATGLATIVAQGNIGANVGGGTSTKNYDVTNSGSSAYVFNGQGLTNSSNPNITLKRGDTYTFTMNTPGHPFYIKSVQGTGSGNAYNVGVTNNGSVTTVVTFTVPTDAPNTLYYNCEFHGPMTGIFTITN